MAMKLILSLYVVSENEKTIGIIDNLRAVLEKNFKEEWQLNVVDVLATPEKAVENNIFATPTLMRDFPAPVIKALGDIANEKRILGVLTKIDQEKSVIVI